MESASQPGMVSDPVKALAAAFDTLLQSRRDLPGPVRGRIGSVTDAEPPADLIQLKRQFIETDAELTALSKTMPSGRAIIAGEAAEEPADRARWNVLHDRLGALVMQIRRHPAFETLSQVDKHQLDEAASKAARAGG